MCTAREFVDRVVPTCLTRSLPLTSPLLSGDAVRQYAEAVRCVCFAAESVRERRPPTISQARLVRGLRKRKIVNTPSVSLKAAPAPLPLRPPLPPMVEGEKISVLPTLRIVS